MKNVFTFDQFLNEGTTAVEPVFTDSADAKNIAVFFNEGQTDVPSSRKKDLVDYIKKSIASSISTIQKFHNNTQFPLPQFVKLYVGTSSTGDFKRNKEVAEARLKSLEDLFLEAMSSYGVRDDVAYKLIVKSIKNYKPSKIDRDFLDPEKVKPSASERIGYIVIDPITTKGLTTSQIQAIQGNVIDASGWFNNLLIDTIDEDTILAQMKKLETYSDIKDLDSFLISSREGTLQSFLNGQLEDSDQTPYLVKISDHLNSIAKRSGKQPISKVTDGKISILI